MQDGSPCRLPDCDRLNQWFFNVLGENRDETMTLGEFHQAGGHPRTKDNVIIGGEGQECLTHCIPTRESARATSRTH